jgi:RNA polymerase sigma-70 factor (ECF subfamily)
MSSNQLEFQEIYAAYQPKILRYLVRMVGEEEAEDLTQEVFAKVDQALHNFRGESKPSTWLYRIAANTACDWLRSPTYRRMAQKKPLEDAAGDEIEEIDDRDLWTGEKMPLVDQQCVRQEMNTCIQSYVERLPEIYRRVLVLSDMQKLKDGEIAERLGIPLSTVKIRLHRARAMLREEFETHCEYYWVEEALKHI